jgi:uncharacterized protein (DUF486 family)
MALFAQPVVQSLLLLTASSVFMTFAWYAHLNMGQEIRMNYVYAGVCLLGAVYFVFRA